MSKRRKKTSRFGEPKPVSHEKAQKSVATQEKDLEPEAPLDEATPVNRSLGFWSEAFEIKVFGQNIRLTVFWVLMIIIAISLVTFGWGLWNQFLNDDTSQIVYNSYVHSLTNFFKLFTTSSIGNSLTNSAGRLAGLYYRPLMFVAFAFIYLFAGLHPFWYHAIQLLIYDGCAFLIFLVFRYFFRDGLSLLLAVVFLVDPINTQNVYYIANIQEPLYVFFGLLGLWTYLKFQDKPTKYMWFSAASIFLSMMAKEAGILFALILLTYSLICDRKRFWNLALFMAGPLMLYALFRIGAMGLHFNRIDRQIDMLTVGERFLTLPSIVWFYLVRLVWPWQLMAFYDWADKTMSFGGVILPLIGVMLTAIGIGYVGRYLTRRKNKRDATLFWFFLAWTAIGLLLNLQIIPLDETASETWIVVALIGFLGMIGALVEAFQPKIHRYRKWVLVGCGLLLVGMSFRSAMRAQDWSSQQALAQADVRQTNADWVSDVVVAQGLTAQGNYAQAIKLDEVANQIFPSASGDATLAQLMFAEGDYADAQTEYFKSIKVITSEIAIDQMAKLQMYYAPKSEQGLKNIETALYIYPKDGSLITSLALFTYKIGDYGYADYEMKQAYALHAVSDSWYQAVMNMQPISIDVFGQAQTIRPGMDSGNSGWSGPNE